MDSRSRVWAAIAVIGGIGLLLGLELIEEPDAGALDLLLDLLEIVPIVLTSVGVVLLFRATRHQRDDQARLIRELEAARAQGQRWRADARAHITGRGHAIGAQFARWNLTDAEREVALVARSLVRLACEAFDPKLAGRVSVEFAAACVAIVALPWPFFRLRNRARRIAG